MERLCKRPFLFLLVGILLISFSPILVKLSGESALRCGFYRHAFGFMFLLPLLLLRKERWQNGKWSVFFPLLCGVLFFVDLWGWHVGIGYIGPGMATLIGNFQVFFVTLLSMVFLRERPPIRFFLAVPPALAGVYMISQSGHDSDNHYVLGVLLCLMAAACYAIFLLINRKSQSMTNRISAEMNLFYITICTGVLFGLAILARGESFALETPGAFWSLLAYGFFPHFLGWIIIIRCLPLVQATVASISLLVQPVLTFIWEVIIFQKSFSPLQLAGGALAIVAIYMATVKRTDSSE